MKKLIKLSIFGILVNLLFIITPVTSKISTPKAISATIASSVSIIDSENNSICSFSLQNTNCQLNAPNSGNVQFNPWSGQIDFNNASIPNGTLKISGGDLIINYNGESTIGNIDASDNITFQGSNGKLNFSSATIGNNLTVNYGSFSGVNQNGGTVIQVEKNLIITNGGNLSAQTTSGDAISLPNQTSDFIINGGGTIIATSQKGKGIYVGGDVNISNAGNVNVTGSTAGLWSDGSISMTGGTTLIGTVTGDNGVGVLAHGINVINNAKLTGQATNSESGSTYGVISGWRSDITVGGKTNDGSLVTGIGSVGVTTIYPTAQDAGNIHINGGTINGSTSSGDGVSGLNIFVDSGGEITGTSSSAHGIGAIGVISIDNSTASGDAGKYGIGSNGDISISNSDVKASGTDEGICTDGNVNITGDSKVDANSGDDVKPIPILTLTDFTNSDINNGINSPSDTETNNPSNSSESPSNSESPSVENSSESPDVVTTLPSDVTGSSDLTTSDSTGIHAGGDVFISLTDNGEINATGQSSETDINNTKTDNNGGTNSPNEPSTSEPTSPTSEPSDTSSTEPSNSPSPTTTSPSPTTTSPSPTTTSPVPTETSEKTPTQPINPTDAPTPSSTSSNDSSKESTTDNEPNKNDAVSIPDTPSKSNVGTGAIVAGNGNNSSFGYSPQVTKKKNKTIPYISKTGKVKLKKSENKRNSKLIISKNNKISGGTILKLKMNNNSNDYCSIGNGIFPAKNIAIKAPSKKKDFNCILWTIIGLLLLLGLLLFLIFKRKYLYIFILNNSAKDILEKKKFKAIYYFNNTDKKENGELINKYSMKLLDDKKYDSFSSKYLEKNIEYKKRLKKY